MQETEEQKLQRALQLFKPYILDLEKACQKLQFGQIDVVLRVHDGFVADMVLVEKKRTKYAIPTAKQQDRRVDDVPVSTLH